MTRLCLPLLIALGTTACAANPCQDFIDSVDRASKVPGCSEYTKQFRDQAATIDVDDCPSSTADQTFQEHVSSCLALIQDGCDAEVQNKVATCLSQ